MSVMYLDESEHGDFLAVGGFYCRLSEVRQVESAWAKLKDGLGLDPADPLKWSPQGETHARLKRTRGVDEARRRAAAAIADFPIHIVVAVLQERRGQYVVLGPGVEAEAKLVAWKDIHPKGGGVRHFYPRGVEFALQRFADHLQAHRPGGDEHHYLVLDNLEWASNRGKMTQKLKKELDKVPVTERWVIRDWIEKGAQAVCEAYAGWHRAGFREPYDHLESLGALGFESTFHQCHADWSNAMQVADFVAGCFGAFVSDLSCGKSGVARECVRTTRSKVRAEGSTFGLGMWGNGFVLWPPNPEIWAKAKGALM